MVIALGAVLALLVFGLLSRGDTEYSKSEWAISSSENRYRMALYLEKHEVLIGKSKSEVVLELGPPAQSSSDYMYYTINQPWGFKDGFSLNFAEGKVVSAYVHD